MAEVYVSTNVEADGPIIRVKTLKAAGPEN
jgi:hypothetical protein